MAQVPKSGEYTPSGSFLTQNRGYGSESLGKGDCTYRIFSMSQNFFGRTAPIPPPHEKRDCLMFGTLYFGPMIKKILNKLTCRGTLGGALLLWYAFDLRTHLLQLRVLRHSYIGACENSCSCNHGTDIVYG